MLPIASDKYLQDWSFTYIYIYIVVSFFLLFFSSAFVNSASHPSKIPVINQLTFLGQAFSRFVDLSLGYLVQVGSLQYNTNGMYMVTVQMGRFFNIISSLMDILYLFWINFVFIMMQPVWISWNLKYYCMDFHCAFQQFLKIIFLNLDNKVRFQYCNFGSYVYYDHHIWQLHHIFYDFVENSRHFGWG